MRCNICGCFEADMNKMFILTINDNPLAKNPRKDVRKNDICLGCLGKVWNILDAGEAMAKSIENVGASSCQKSYFR